MSGDSTGDNPETPPYRILYTGDFRFDEYPLTSISALHNNNNLPICIDEMYLDTTFCNPSYEEFPTRNKALESIWNLVSGWIRKNGMYRNQRDTHVVLFHLPGIRLQVYPDYPTVKPKYHLYIRFK